MVNTRSVSKNAGRSQTAYDKMPQSNVNKAKRVAKLPRQGQ